MSEEATTVEEAVGKPFWKSKTFYVSVITGLLGWIPNVSDLIVQNPEVVSTALGVIFTVLRFITKDKITIS